MFHTRAIRPQIYDADTAQTSETNPEGRLCVLWVLCVLWALKNKCLRKIYWREGLWVLWAMKNKSLIKRTGGRRAVGGVGNEKYESNKKT